VVQPLAQPKQGEQTPTTATQVQPNLGDHFPMTPQEDQGIPIGANTRNAMPMRPPYQDFRVQPNHPRFGMPLGEPYEPRQGRLHGDGFVNLIKEPRLGGMNARPIPHYGGPLGALVEEPWLGRRPPRQ
jgi:hypothetical protein